MTSLTKGTKTTLINALTTLANTATSTITPTTGDCPTGYATPEVVHGTTTIQVSLTWDASVTTAGAYLYIYGSQDDTVYDITKRETRYLPPKTSGGADVQSFTIDDAPAYIKVAIMNESGYAINSITVTAQSQTWA